MLIKLKKRKPVWLIDMIFKNQRECCSRNNLISEKDILILDQWLLKLKEF